MTTHHPMEVTHPSDMELRIQRRFDAPRQLVWDAHTQPELIRQWMQGMEGWSMSVCTFEARLGGAYRYEWRRDSNGDQMGMGGTILEYAPIERLVATEGFDEAWYPGEVVNTSLFADIEASEGAAAGTLLTVTSRWESAEAMQVALQTPMLEGMTSTYDWLEELLVEMTGKEQP